MKKSSRNQLVGLLNVCLLSSLGVACGKSSSTAAGPTSATIVAHDKTSNSNIALSYAILQANSNATPNKEYPLSVLDYNPCVWAQNHNDAYFPKDATFLGLYLLNETNGVINPPIAGIYQVQTPPAGATGLFLDPNVSGFGIINNCVGQYPGLSSGSLTLTQVNSNVATGSVNLTLADGTTITGTFDTETCSGPFDSSPPANDPAACATLQ